MLNEQHRFLHLQKVGGNKSWRADFAGQTVANSRAQAHAAFQQIQLPRRRNKRAINCILVEPGKPGIASLIVDTGLYRDSFHRFAQLQEVSAGNTTPVNFSGERTCRGGNRLFPRSCCCTGKRSTCEATQVDHVVMSVHRPRRQFPIRIEQHLGTAFVSCATF